MPLNGKLEEQSIYDAQNKLLQKNKYNYIASLSNRYWSITFKDTYSAGSEEWFSPEEEWGSYYGAGEGIGAVAGDRVLINKTEIKSYDISLSSKESTIDGIITREDYTYNPNTLKLKEKKITSEANSSLAYKYTYPNDYSCGVSKLMSDKNMLSNVVEEQIFRNNLYIGGKLTQFSQNRHNQLVPSILSFSENTSKPTNPIGFSCKGVNKTIFPSDNVLYKEYDTYGNPLYLTKDDADKVVYLWSYGGQYPIAEITNATYAEVLTALPSVFGTGTTFDTLSKLSSPNETKLKDGSLQKAFPNALVTTYTYRPLVGMLTTTDPTGTTSYYDYDTFGRLKETYIMENGVKKIVQKYDYHYQNQ